MKKTNWSLIGILLISILSTLVFTACDKDTWCYLDVTVVDAKYKNAPAAGAWVKVQYVNPQNAEDCGTIADTGQCDMNGVFHTKFAAPAIFTIAGRVDEPDTINQIPHYREGLKTTRLKEGENVEITVKVSADSVKRGNANFQPLF